MWKLVRVRIFVLFAKSHFLKLERVTSVPVKF